MQDKQLFKATFKNLLGIDSWWGWRVYLSALFGLPMDEKQLAFYRKHTGRQDPPSKQPAESYVISGRRSGKTLTAALIAVFLACFRDYSGILAPGETGILMILSADRRQARTILGYINALLSVPLLNEMVLNRRKESIDLNNKIRLEIHTSSFKSTRGYTCVGVIADEVCFWETQEGSANPDTEVLAAVRPAMASVPNALLVAISSPYSKRGEMWTQYRQNWSQENPDCLVWQSDSRAMNPTLNPVTVAAAYVRDAASARAEFGANFRDDVETFISLEQLEERIVAGRRELPYRSDRTYVGFADPSGGRGDSFVLAIAHLENDKAILDLIREIQAPFSPEAAVEELSGICKAYKVSEIVGDSYGGDWARESFAKWGVNYRLSEKNRSEIYLAFLPSLMSNQVQLLDHPRMVNQLCGLERRTARSGRDSIDHAIGGHDDCANAACGALTLILADSISGRLGVVELMREIKEGRRLLPEARAEGNKRLAPNPTKCKLCGGVRIWQSQGIDPAKRVRHCNQCGANDDVLIIPEDNRCPNHPDGHTHVTTGGAQRCMHCGHSPQQNVTTNGLTKEQYNSGQAARLSGLGQFATRW